MALRLPILLFALVAIFSTGIRVAPGHAQAFDHKGLARLVLENHIRPGYAKLLDAAQGFDAAVEAFCDAPPGQSMQPLKLAFRELVLAWARIEHVRFGPIMDQHRHARVFYWPDRKGLGRRQVRRAIAKSDPSVFDPVSLAEKSVALQGLGAVEILLYSKSAAVIEKPGPQREFRCNYLRAIGANIENIAGDVQSEWASEDGYTATFLSPGAENATYLDETEVTLEIAKMFLVGLERLRDIEIAGPLGLSRKSSRRTRAAFEPSGLSAQILAAKLEGLTMLYTSGGLLDRIETHESSMGKSILTELKYALSHLQRVSGPMSDLSENKQDEDALLASGYPLKNARTQTGRVLSEAAGLSLGFNALDGD